MSHEKTKAAPAPPASIATPKSDIVRPTCLASTQFAAMRQQALQPCAMASDAPDQPT